jgi:hypothetical protein
MTPAHRRRAPLYWDPEDEAEDILWVDPACDAEEDTAPEAAGLLLSHPNDPCPRVTPRRYYPSDHH